MRLLIVKDLRLFRRDPVQWSQFLIFFGLLVLYFLNIRRFSYSLQLRRLGEHGQLPEPLGRGAAAVDVHHAVHLPHDQPGRPAVLDAGPAAAAARHDPLEQVPVRGRRVDRALFRLILLSDTMLGVSSLVLVSHQLTCLLLCLGLSGIAVGLGARLPNLREQSPVADRRRLRRHAEPGRQHALHPGGRAADGPALPLLSGR